ncbi:MAG: UvrD-helicase domain-containing protein [Acidobacteriota bacterium]|nr:UvrD-helicase domain-containing protein [Acidobacteriota bacterium]
MGATASIEHHEDLREEPLVTTARDVLDGLLEGLNGPQREAVVHGDGPLLILAGAGSGKTRVLTHRIAHLIHSGQARPHEILAITFTNKAAAEMRSRVERLLGGGTRGMWLSTFHAACARILRAHAERLGFTSQFTIYDQADARRLVKRSMEELGMDPKRHPSASVQNRISQAKNMLLDAGAYEALGGGPFEAAVAEVFAIYERDLQRSNAMDFDDLLLLTVSLLERHSGVRERYAQSFRHILVDEYQDTNHAQYRLLQLLVAERAAAGGGEDQGSPGGHRNLAVVGDDAQSVFGFRGADVRNILDFQADFPDATVVKLEQNYRSTQNILRAANAIIANNRGAIAKELWSDLGDGERIGVRELDDEHAEARHVVGEVERLLEGGVSRSEIAVFYRTNAMSRVLEDQLVRREIAYQVIGAAKFYERAEIKDAVAYLAILANPSDVVSFTRIANSPRRGIGQTTLARVVSHAMSVDEAVWSVAAEPDRVPGLTAAAARALTALMQTLAGLRERSRAGLGVAELIAAVLDETGYAAALEAEDTIEAQGRLENLEQLVEVAREFDAAAQPGEGGLDAFLQQVALSSATDQLASAGEPGGERTAEDTARDEGVLTLMTLHNAKGSEYRVVFITGCEDGVIPHSRALDEGGLEEERRLFYVGVTRAMRELHLSSARRRTTFGAGAYGLPSRFLGEIPAELCDQEEPAAFARPAMEGFRGATPVLGGGVRRTARAPRRVVEERFAVGDDVVHGSFGEGVVTGLQGDGVITVRFAGDGSERTLLAEYATLARG